MNMRALEIPIVPDEFQKLKNRLPGDATNVTEKYFISETKEYLYCLEFLPSMETAPKVGSS